MLKATPAQRLEWLEEAIQLAAQTGALQRLRARQMEEVRSLFPEEGVAKGSKGRRVEGSKSLKKL